jgi:selenium metabolism protein YedF
MDARWLSCPQPVVITEKIIDGAGEVTIIVNNSISGNNARCMEENHGREVNIEEKEDRIYFHLTKDATAEFAHAATPAVGLPVLVMASDQMGRGEKQLGSVLIRGLLDTLGEVSPLPDKMMFFTTGVNLTREGSEVSEYVRTLKEKGVKTLVCGTGDVFRSQGKSGRGKGL